MAPPAPLLLVLFVQLLVVCTQTYDSDEVLILSTDWGERYIQAKDVPAYNVYNQGVQAASSEQNEMAIELYKEALRMKPDIPEALINYSNLLKIKDALMSEKLLEQAILVADHSSLKVIALSNLGHLKQKQAGKDLNLALEAESFYLSALQIDPDFEDALFNYGTLLDLLGKVGAAQRNYERVLQLNPEHQTAALNLANCHFYRKNYQQAISIFEKLTYQTSGRNKLSTLNNLGQVYRDAGQHLAAFQVFTKAVEEFPTDFISISNLLQTMRSLCYWDNIADIEISLFKNQTHFLMPYDALFSPRISLKRQVDTAKAHALPWAVSNRNSCELENYRKNLSSTKLNVMYLSFDFRKHPMGYLTQGLLSSHSKKQFHVTAVSYGEEDDSAPRRRIRESVDTWMDVFGDSDVAATELMRQSLPDVVVDLMGFTRGTRTALAASRPAPLLVNYLGFPSTMGLYSDYAMVDRICAPPEAARGFSEKLIFLPNTYQANAYPLDSPFCSGLIYDNEARSDTCFKDARYQMSPNITSNNTVVCNFNNIDKMEHVSFEAWMQLLSIEPSIMLALLSSSERTESNLRGEAAARGVHPRRLLFLKHVDLKKHLARISGCDFVVDNFIYGAHTTASDALWSSVPIVSLRGLGGAGDVYGRMQSRVGASLLREAGVGWLATHTVKEFSVTAEQLAANENIRLGARRKISASHLRSALFDTAKLTLNIEAAYRGIVEIRTASRCQAMHLILPPKHGNRFEESVQHRLIAELEQSNVDSSLIISERLLSGFPSNADAWHLRGLAHFKKGVHHQDFAITSIRRALNLFPNTAFYWANLAVAQRQDNKYPSSAVQSLLIATSIDPLDLSHVLSLDGLLSQKEMIVLLTCLFQRYESRNEWPQSTALSQAYMQLGISYGAGSVEAVNALKKSVELDRSNHPARLKLGAALEAVGSHSQALETWLEAVQLQHIEDFNANSVKLAPRPSGMRVIAIYCDEYGQSWWPNWGPRSLKTGLGGSEEAVVFLTRELVELGYHVEVYASPTGEDVGRDSHGVHWYPYGAYDVAYPPHVFIAWRYHISAALALRTGAKVFVWLQDVPSFNTFTPEFISSVNGIFCLSEFHVRQLPSHAQSKAIVTPNGIDSQFFVDGSNWPTRFVYGSAPNRGLETVLRSWSTIRERIGPDATLEVYYGFSNSFLKYGRNTIPHFESWLSMMTELLKQPGVVMHGMVDHRQLAEGYANSGFILYPTTYPETGCVTVMKAMAMGAIPITSLFTESTLPELTREFDLSPRPFVVSDPTWIDDWIEKVVSSSELDSRGNLKQHRSAMKQYARDKFLWSSVAKLWDASFV